MTPMERSKKLASFEIKPIARKKEEKREFVQAPEKSRRGHQNQFQVGTRFNEWTVTGTSVLKNVLISGSMVPVSHTPVKCSCGLKALKPTWMLRSSSLMQSCGHDKSDKMRRIIRDECEKKRK